MSSRVHVGSGEPITRSGGMHNYILGLSSAQSVLGHRTAVLDQISRRGTYRHFRGDGELEDLVDGDAVLHMHFAYSALAVLLNQPCARAARKKLLHFHGPWFAEGKANGDSLVRAVAKWGVEAATYWRGGLTYVAASRAFGHRLHKSFGVPTRNIHVVNPGVDVARFMPGDKLAARRRLGIPADPTVFVCVRRLERRMGIENAVAAMVGLPDAHLVIFGTGSLADELGSQIARLGLEDRVHLFGRVSDELLPTAYQAGDYSLVPTVALEGFGLVVLESFASGVPVISSCSGGLGEAQGPFADEWCVSDASPDVLRKAMARAIRIQDRIDRGEFRAYAEARSLRAMAMKVEELVS